jgi:lysophospholipase L1-like esterase
MRGRIPIRTALTLLTFAGIVLLPEIVPPLSDYQSLDPHNIFTVLNFPLPSARNEPDTDPRATEESRAVRLEREAPKYLLDPAHSLGHFYESLAKGGKTRIVHYGDSPTTADLITADARAMLQMEFGDGGSGFVLIARPWAWYKHRGVDMDASEWTIDIAGSAQIKDGMHGLGGVSFVGSPGAIAHWRLKNTSPSTIEIAYLAQPDGGAFEVVAEDRQLGVVDTSADLKIPGYASFAIPAGSKRFTLRVTRGTVRLYGADFRKAAPGVIYASLGINGANVTLLSRSFNERHWAAVLKHYNPDLVIVNYGTNESGFEQFVDGSWASEMKEVVRRLQAALPGVSVLLMSPMDRGERKAGGEIETIPMLPRLVSIEARVANETGAAFFNTYEAMGGEGTMGRWYSAEPRLVGADFIHPMPAGAKIVGELLFNALRDGYSQYKLRQLDDTAGLDAGHPPHRNAHRN